MKVLTKPFALVAAGLLAALATPPSLAQTTDGYHAILVFPVVVDTASFTQRFTIDNPQSSDISVQARYFPAEGTSQATAIDCGTYTIPLGRPRTFTSLRQLCPTLASGSQFGFLYLREAEPALSVRFAAYSRVSNPQGNGFAVESFPAHDFAPGTSRVTGARRLAAGPGNPAFQTNCFVGAINHVNAKSVLNLDTQVRVTNSSGGQFGSKVNVPVSPGKLTRILDIFAFVGAPAGDYDNAVVEFDHNVDDPSGMINFCTVQDNTSFGADFRIAKQLQYPDGVESLLSRASQLSQGLATSSAPEPQFRLLAGGARHNTHVMYFRHPDYVQCEIIDPNTQARALPAYGLEMRMMASDGTTVLAGGNGQTGFGKIYLGDKAKTVLGSNDVYTIDVEKTEGADTVTDIQYQLRCQSGSGHSLGDMIVNNLEEDVF